MHQKSIQQLQKEINDWSNKTFGSHDRTKDILNHLYEEVSEVIEAKDSLQYNSRDNTSWYAEYDLKTEFADCFMLLLDAAANSGIDVNELVDYSIMKHKINEKRNWGEKNTQGYHKHK
jgi:NTP pyrophosphatase (non-canonical NTP hydrolase)